jgi:hypothetical protein
MSRQSVAVAAVFGVVVATHLTGDLTSVFGPIATTKDLLPTGVFS